MNRALARMLGTPERTAPLFGAGPPFAARHMWIVARPQMRLAVEDLPQFDQLLGASTRGRGPNVGRPPETALSVANAHLR